METTSMNRRNFVKGAGFAVAAGLALGSTVAMADESADARDAYTFADTVAWDAEYDVVVLGMGFSGMAAAIEAANNGAAVLLCEKAPEGEAGGNSRVCGQMWAYGHDDEEATRAYYEGMAASRETPEDVMDFMTKSIAHLADSLVEKYGFDPALFTDQKISAFAGYLSPEYPEMPGSDKMSLMSIHETMSDSFFWQSVNAILTEQYADRVDVWYETPGVGLIQDPASKAVIGVTVDRRGETRNVRALNGVCVCTGGFERDTKMVQDYLNMVNYCIRGGLYNEGDGIKMCQQVGARLWHMTGHEGNNCGYRASNAERAALIMGKPLQGASMVVGTGGQRFFNETEPARHGHLADGNNMWEWPKYPEHMWVVMDETQKALVDEAGGFNADYADQLMTCATVADLAAAIGCDEAAIQQTIDDFNFYVESGRDFEIGRDVATMRAFDGAGYYAMPAAPCIFNTQGGPERNAQAEVLDIEGNPIPHLYSAGEMGGFTTCMYQGGTNVAECNIMGWQAGKNAAAPKDPLPVYTLAPRVQSSPAHLGDETDLGASGVPAVEAAEGELVGVGKGIGGDVPVAVTLDADGKIAEVRVGDNSETQGIGSKAIEQLPEKFVGLSAADEIDAVDGVSGATLTSNALKDAVKQALGL